MTQRDHLIALNKDEDTVSFIEIEHLKTIRTVPVRCIDAGIHPGGIAYLSAH